MGLLGVNACHFKVFLLLVAVFSSLPENLAALGKEKQGANSKKQNDIPLPASEAAGT